MRSPIWAATRSEEHTSELQSLRHLVCRLLLEKKKSTTKNEGVTQMARVMFAHRLDAQCATVRHHLTPRPRQAHMQHPSSLFVDFFFFNNTAPPEIYPLSLPDALPI